MRFCDGTVNRLAAARKSFQPCARLSSKTAAMVRRGVNAVHCSATALALPTSSTSSLTSDRSGPCRVERTVIVRDSPPATLIVSCRVSSGTCLPLYSYRSPSTRSRYRTVTSAYIVLTPHAMRRLCPTTTPGIPENEKPDTSYGHDSVTRRQCRPTWYQMPGIDGARCGSLARMGSPVAERLPSTTQELEPMPSPVPSRSGKASAASRVFANDADTADATTGG